MELGLIWRYLCAQVLGGLLASAVAAVAPKAALALTPVDLFDDRSVRDRGFDLIYEAR